MNSTIKVLENRCSIRSYLDQELTDEEKETILNAAYRAPTAGNMMLYSIIEVESKQIKEKLVETCDNQPFIKKAPFVLIFLADYQRWFDYYQHCQVEDFCQQYGITYRFPQEGDLMIACSDALIAAQNAVIAAESMGIGSCYIGDIMEKHEVHREMFDLPPYVFPIAMVCFGYPANKPDQPRPRFDGKFIRFKDRYHRLSPDELDEMFKEREALLFKNKPELNGAVNFGQFQYRRKFGAEFSQEMSRSVRAALARWLEH
jgi:nitroreductase